MPTNDETLRETIARLQQIADRTDPVLNQLSPSLLEELNQYSVDLDDQCQVQQYRNEILDEVRRTFDHVPMGEDYAAHVVYLCRRLVYESGFSDPNAVLEAISPPRRPNNPPYYPKGN